MHLFGIVKAVIKIIPRAEHGCGASEPSAQG